MQLTSIATKRIFEISRSCHTARPPHRPMWSASERRSRASFRQLLNSDYLIRSRWMFTTRDHCAEYTFRARRQTRRVRSRTQCRSCIATTNAANRESTLKMGRRIMTERGRKRRRRARRLPRVARRVATEPIEARSDDALRAFVRVLARQAARELFDSEARCKPEVLH